MIVTMVIASNSLFAQDTSHTKLVDKYYPESNAPEPPAPILDKATTAPLNTTLNKPASSTVSQAPVINPTASQPPQINNVESTTVPETPISQVQTTPNNIYNDTRLGSSSTENDSYIKNDNGAGSITTNPNKGNGTNVIPSTNSNPPTPIYRDTRLGSSSPLYNTYEKNDDGAGAITTNPNKG